MVQQLLTLDRLDDHPHKLSVIELFKFNAQIMQVVWILISLLVVVHIELKKQHTRNFSHRVPSFAAAFCLVWNPKLNLSGNAFRIQSEISPRAAVEGTSAGFPNFSCCFRTVILRVLRDRKGLCVAILSFRLAHRS